ncbi:MAG: hypothetical protein IT181_01210 [Acidobacteria bacterium]|nr:hypothetical protein [Acidobacteriota bacterium]
MIADLIVWASVVFTLIFVAAWAASPALRAWIERPKHRFLEAVRGYDARARPSGDGEEPRKR